MDTFNTSSSPELLNMRLDKALPLMFSGHSRSYYETLFDKDMVKVNHKTVKKSYKLTASDTVSVTIPEEPALTLAKKQIAFDIIFEDEHLLIINKPAGLVVHPAPGHVDDTVVNGLLHYCDLEVDADEIRPGIVHRLDKDTSGILITCKTKKAHEAMSSLFMNREITKKYLAICLGKVKEETIEAPLARHKQFRQKMSVNFTEKAKNATTIVTPLFHDHEISLARLEILTGRTHQIRVHMQYRKTPILGDSVYGYPQANASFKAARQYLHAESLSFIHPFTHLSLTLTAPLAPDMLQFLSSKKVDSALYLPVSLL